MWWDFVLALEHDTGKPAGALTTPEFQAALHARLDTTTLTARERMMSIPRHNFSDALSGP